MEPKYLTREEFMEGLALHGEKMSGVTSGMWRQISQEIKDVRDDIKINTQQLNDVKINVAVIAEETKKIAPLEKRVTETEKSLAKGMAVFSIVLIMAGAAWTFASGIAQSVTASIISNNLQK